MSVREYIGARYVPVFAEPIEWDNTKAYEPLTIVTHEGNSYTSTQSVPIGIDIANTSYWVVTGNYNAQIEQYRKETQAAVNTAEVAETKAEVAKTAADNAQSTADEAHTLAMANEADLLPLTETGKLVYDPGTKSWVGIQNTAYTADNGTRLYIIPRAAVTSGVGGALKIFADNYPNAQNYRDIGIYYSADQEGQTGSNDAGVFWINAKKNGYEKNADIGFSFDDGKKEVMRLIDAQHTPFVYIGSGDPKFTNDIGSIYYGFQTDCNCLINNPYRIFFGEAGSIYSDANNNLLESCSKARIFSVSGNEVVEMTSTGLHLKQNIYINNPQGIVMTSPNGTSYKITINNSGQLQTTQI